ncbi:MAG: ABC transporter ATP-binding protein, partial [Intestinibaculum porci]|uniref:ATP-binding cassette domain-containing protein n=1 Tax=Intestinibaculum porci TaxID=2487118 RepID=UPI002409AD20
YPGHQETAVSDINMTFHQNEMIGITGEVASGKSLLGKALIGEANYQGRIYINGQDLKSLPPHDRHGTITYMGHDPMLLSDSIANNISLGDEIDVAEYLKLVCLDEEVSHFKDGMHTMIGNGGLTLSGGQAARVALARALAHVKPIIILDDPFSAVDEATMQKILDHLRKLSGHIILLMTHRLSILPQLDQVVFIDDHKVQVDTHDALMAKNVHYVKLIEGGKDHA